MHIKFLHFYLAAQGGGGLNPLNPPPPVDPPLLFIDINLNMDWI